MEEYISTKEASDLTGYTDWWVRELARDGKIESKKIGQAVLIDRASLLDYQKRTDAENKKKHRRWSKE